MSEAKLRTGFLSEMRRFPSDGWIAGVCAGIADYFNWKVRLVRLVAFLLLIFTGFWPSVIVYCVLWYVMDEGSLQDPYRPNYRRPPPQSDVPHSPAPAGTTPTSGGAGMSDLKARFAKLEERLGNMEECVTSKDFELRRELRRLEN